MCGARNGGASAQPRDGDQSERRAQLEGHAADWDCAWSATNELRVHRADAFLTRALSTPQFVFIILRGDASVARRSAHAHARHHGFTDDLLVRDRPRDPCNWQPQPACALVGHAARTHVVAATASPQDPTRAVARGYSVVAAGQGRNTCASECRTWPTVPRRTRLTGPAATPPPLAAHFYAA